MAVKGLHRSVKLMICEADVWCSNAGRDIQAFADRLRFTSVQFGFVGGPVRVLYT